MEKKKVRNSNLELLRIVSMILIIMHHYVVHGQFEWEMTTVNKIMLDVLSLGGKLGVNCFVLITGYFMVQSKMNIKKLIKIMLEIVFYSTSIYIIFTCFNIIPFTFSGIINSIFAITQNAYWFGTTYAILYLLIPFINQSISSFNEKQHRYLCFTLVAIFSIIPTITTRNFEFSHVIWFVTLYYIAGYIRKYPNKYTETMANNVKYSGMIILFMIITTIGFNLLTAVNPDAKYYITYFGIVNSLPLLILSITLFIVFKNMKLKQSKVLNLIASSIFGVYLIHDNVYMRDFLWGKLLKNNTYATSPYLMIHFVFSVIAVFVVCTIIDQIRMQIVEKRVVDKLIDKLYNIYNKQKLKKQNNTIKVEKVLELK